MACCLVCNLFVQKVPAALIDRLLLFNLNLQQLVSLNSIETNAYASALSLTQRSLIVNSAKQLINTSGSENVKVIHDRYYTKDVITLPQFSNFPIQLGSICLIYNHSLDSRCFDIVGKTIFQHAAAPDCKLGDYKTLRNIQKPYVVYIDLHNRKMYIFNVEGNGAWINREVIDLFYGTLEQIHESIARHPFAIYGGSIVAIVIDWYRYRNLDFNINHWLILFKSIFGWIDDKWIVFLLDSIDWSPIFKLGLSHDTFLRTAILQTSILEQRKILCIDLNLNKIRHFR